MEHQALLDDAAEKADRLDRRNAIIVAILGVVGVGVSGGLLLAGELVL